MPDRDGSLGVYKVRGRAVAESDPAEQRGFADEARRQVGWWPEPGRSHLFRVDLSDVTFVRYDAQTGDQFTARWPRGVEFVRRAASATTVGPPQPRREFLVEADP